MAGCGASDRQLVRAKVQQFAEAVTHKDATTICDQVFAPALVEHFKAAGLTCVRGMGIFFSALHNPTLAVGPVTLHGSRASVVTLSGAKGQTAAVRAVNLIKTSDGWRIISLGGSPASATGPSTTAPHTTAPPTTSTPHSTTQPKTSTSHKHTTTSKH